MRFCNAPNPYLGLLTEPSTEPLRVVLNLQSSHHPVSSKPRTGLLAGTVLGHRAGLRHGDADTDFLSEKLGYRYRINRYALWERSPKEQPTAYWRHYHVIAEPVAHMVDTARASRAMPAGHAGDLHMDHAILDTDLPGA